MNDEKKDSAKEILSFIEKHGIAPKESDAAGGKGGKTRRKRGKRRVHRMVIDLHGLRSEAAEARLRGALDRCRSGGMRELLIIHGYGLHSDPAEGPVLKKLVRALLDNALRERYRTYRTAPVRDGGEGATLVTLR